jgi:flagellar basal-body rod protein FlgB
MNLFGELGGVEQLLDFHMQRHSVLAANLANADTPGYEAQDLQFDVSLAAAGGLKGTHAGHITGNEGAASAEVGQLVPAPSVDGNGVQVEQTLAQVTANRLNYEKGLEMWNRRAALLRYVATDGQGG